MVKRTRAVPACPTSKEKPGHRAMAIAVDHIGLARGTGQVVPACSRVIGMASITDTDITDTGTTGRECRKFPGGTGTTAIPNIGHAMGITTAIIRDPTGALQVMRGITGAAISANNSSHP